MWFIQVAIEHISYFSRLCHVTAELILNSPRICLIQSADEPGFTVCFDPVYWKRETYQAQSIRNMINK